MTRYIENEAAYEAAIQRNIKNNARKGNLKRWLAEGDDHQELYDWLANEGKYADIEVRKELSHTVCGNCGEHFHEAGRSDCVWCNTELVNYVDRTEPHPLCEKMWDGDFGTFLMKLAQNLVGYYAGQLQHNARGESVEWWGKLSPKQTTVVRNALARAKENNAKKAEREAQWAAEAANREYVGEVGDKKFAVDGTIAFTNSWEGNYGRTYLTVIRDANDNTIKYKGNFIGRKGEKVKMIATIKAHEEYRGEKQTIVNRPRKIEVG
jgi:hypothetical protein